MSTQICPKCKKDSFSWHIDDEPSGLTDWDCYRCGYQAKENEKDESFCDNCSKKMRSRLKDIETEYWWCSGCNKITQE